MKKSSLFIKLCSVALVSVFILSLAACGGKKKKESTKETTDASETTESVETQATEPTPLVTTIPTYSGPATNDIAVSWEETELSEPTVRYVKCNEFVNVRKGPGTDYDTVAKFTNNMPVIIVATTANGWSKTQDGFYVSSELLTELPN